MKFKMTVVLKLVFTAYMHKNFQVIKNIIAVKNQAGQIHYISSA